MKMKMKMIIALVFIGFFPVLADDPSLKAQPDPTGNAKYAERSRIMVDLDGDGTNDMLLSGNPEEFGKMGGPWAVYLNRGGDYKRIGELWAHPQAISFEPDQARISSDPKTHRFARVWSYLRASGSAGTFGYYRIGKDSVDKMTSIEIYPGDGGTDIGRTMYEAAFKKSPIPFKIQGSTTAEDGTVSWSED